MLQIHRIALTVCVPLVRVRLSSIKGAFVTASIGAHYISNVPGPRQSKDPNIYDTTLELLQATFLYLPTLPMVDKTLA